MWGPAEGSLNLEGGTGRACSRSASEVFIRSGNGPGHSTGGWAGGLDQLDFEVSWRQALQRQSRTGSPIAASFVVRQASLRSAGSP